MALEENLPNVTWELFAAFNDNATATFEDMCRQLFCEEFLGGHKLTHTNTNYPGIEVEPEIEKSSNDGTSGRRISFQAKYFDNRVNYKDIQNSASQTVKHFSGKIDVVYLFCNLTINTWTKGYITVKNILLKANIQLKPISNVELLDLVRRYPTIAKYYFTNRHIYNTPCIACERFVQVDAANGGDACGAAPSHIWLNGTIAEKVEQCKASILSLNLKSIKAEIDLMLSEHVGDVQNQDILKYYQGLILLDEGKQGQHPKLERNLPAQYKGDIDCIKTLIESNEINYLDFVRLRSESQAVMLDLIFKKQKLSVIDELHDKVIANPDTIEKAVREQVDFYYGLSSFNQREYGRAFACLNALLAEKDNNKVRFYMLCSQLMRTVTTYSPAIEKNVLEVKDIWGKFQNAKELATDQVSCNEVLVAEIELNTCRFLGCAEEKYLQDAIGRYDAYSDSVKNDSNVKALFALCVEMDGKFDLAVEIYSTLEWKINSDMAVRLIMALIKGEDYNRAVEVFSELDACAITDRSTGAYLLALSHAKPSEYQKELKKAIETYVSDASSFLWIVFYIEDEHTFNQIALPVLELLIEKNDRFFDSLADVELNAYVAILAHFKCLKFILLVLNCLSSLEYIEKYAANEVYSALYFVLTKAENTDADRPMQIRNPFKTGYVSQADAIADKFLNYGGFKKQFLQIKYLCATIRNLHISALKYAKELFDITQDAPTARNIVAILYERNEQRYDAYAPYLSVLEESDVPEHSMAVAAAYIKLGDESAANKFAYKALYLLNESLDYDVLKSYFAFCNNKLCTGATQSAPTKTARGSVVVTLEKSEVKSNPDKSFLTICVDSESEFNNPDNRSLGLQHVCRSDTLFSKLCSCQVGQILNMGGIRYQVRKIVSRDDYAIGYVFGEIQKSPEKFKGSVWVIKGEDPEKMLEQIKMLTLKQDRTEDLLDAYNFAGNQLGLPIDCVISGNYEKYITTLVTLLFQQDGAYYAGEPHPCAACGKGYIVPTLSTFVLLAVMGWLDVLTAAKNRIIIPDSYVRFFREQYEHEREKLSVSKGSLGFLEDGKPAFFEHDPHVVEIWESIVNFCDELETRCIDDEDRINLTLVQNYTVESLISGFRINDIQLDALVLARKENAIYLCDDLFFRKIATIMQIRNINFTALLYHYMTDDYVIEVIEKLSKTNYIWLPLLARNNDEATEIIKNLLSGSKKKVIYSYLLTILSRQKAKQD